MAKASPKDYTQELKALFPEWNAKCRMAFSVALAAEANGDMDKAEDYLQQAIDHE